MEFSWSASLTHRASIAVVSSLWNHCNIIADIRNLILRIQNHKDWADIECDVVSALHEIELPYAVTIILKNLVQPMGVQIGKWISITQIAFATFRDLPDIITFAWTEKGILDYTKTTQLIIDSCSDMQLKFCLACVFCIEETILKIWPSVADISENILSESFFSSHISDRTYLIPDNAVMYWVYFLNGDIDRFMTLTQYTGVRNTYEFGFLFLLHSTCESSLSYFLKFIDPDRKERLILQAFQNMFHSTRLHDGNVVLFLFSHLTEASVQKIINENSYSVLSSFLEWPSQEFLLPTAKSQWNNLTNISYLKLLQDMVEFAARYCMTNIYMNLVKQFWQATPPPFKDYIKSKCIAGTFLSRLYMHKNTNEIIQMIFNDCDINEKQQMIFYFEGMNICDFLVLQERWETLKLFVKSCIPNAYVMEEFIKEYENYEPVYSNKERDLRTETLFDKLREWY